MTSSDRTFAVTNINVIPMDKNTVLRNYTLLITGDRIEKMGPSMNVDLPESIYTIDGRNKFIMPGLSDMHTHIAPSIFADNLEAGIKDLELYLCTGVTTIRIMSGNEGHLKLKELQEKGEVQGPQMYLGSPIIEGENNVWDFALKITSTEHVPDNIQQLKETGYDFIKVYHTITREVYKSILEESANFGLSVVGHVPFEVGIELALDSGQKSIEHLRGYDFDGLAPEDLVKDGGRSAVRFRSMMNMTQERRTELIEKTVRSSAWNCPTLVCYRLLHDFEQRRSLSSHPTFKDLHKNTQESIKYNDMDDIFSEESREAMQIAEPSHRLLVNELHQAGANLLAGTDTPVPYLIPSFTIIDEIKNLYDSGLSAYTALKTSTADAHRFIGDYDEVGSISPGKRADLIILDENPLDNIENLWRLDSVISKGNIINKEEIEAIKSHTPG